MPRNARVPVNISGWTVKPLGPHEPCRTDGTVGEKSLLFLPFDQEAVHPLLAVSRPDCMADIGSAFRAAGFPEEVTNVLLTSWSQSTKKRYQGP